MWYAQKRNGIGEMGNWHVGKRERRRKENENEEMWKRRKLCLNFLSFVLMENPPKYESRRYRLLRIETTNCEILNYSP